jgi:hypothetical protein
MKWKDEDTLEATFKGVCLFRIDFLKLDKPIVSLSNELYFLKRQ